MPIYAFRCAACDHDFDRLQKLSDPDPDACPACGERGEVRRKLTAPAFRLAGSGWYETDFKKDGDKKRNLVDGAGQAEAKPDVKPDAKPGGDKPAEKKAEPAKAAGDSKPAAKPEPKSAAKPAAGA